MNPHRARPARLLAGLTLVALLGTGCADLALGKSTPPQAVPEADVVVTASPTPTGDDAADPTTTDTTDAAGQQAVPSADTPGDRAAEGADSPGDENEEGDESDKASDDEAGTAGPAAPGTADAQTGTPVAVGLDEWTVVPDTGAVSAGPVSFITENTGAAPHELLVIRAESLEALPTDEDGAVDEDALGDAVLGETKFLRSGESDTLTLDLEPGTYALVCNLVKEDVEIESHYVFGMATEFSVTE
jgi:uncharacterized cupredoxin-like copper-binding protein